MLHPFPDLAQEPGGHRVYGPWLLLAGGWRWRGEARGSKDQARIRQGLEKEEFIDYGNI